MLPLCCLVAGCSAASGSAPTPPTALAAPSPPSVTGANEGPLHPAAATLPVPPSGDEEDPTPQINTWTDDWIEFYCKHRLGYQLELASRRYGDSAILEKGQRLIKNIRPLFDGAVIEPACFMVMPKQPGFEKRRDLYLLYHYLNHYNLFGSGYRSSAMSIIEDYLYVLAA
ncbi:protein-ribulosamine 3-kinase, chloroplastic-like [Miscanthus floridulus]|uniref:protein-ribulosamine 3-kinase, chloroplastic-like n=1 Tax=Miscanthus floridulus TaxID=154761 RepID=UPI00345AF8E0